MKVTSAKVGVDIAHSACPHDCPSTCALEIERKDTRTIGRVWGAKENRYTAGVICAKVARYAERVHHPDRLTKPLRRSGAKGDGIFKPITWDQALDEVAEAFLKATQKFGSETVWPHYFAGTMGLVQRDGIHRLRHALRYSGQHSTICTALSYSGWNAGAGSLRGADPREMALSDLIVIWGTNVVNTQINVLTHATRARKERAAKIVVIDPYCNGTAEIADMHLALRPGTDGALACAVMHILFRDGYADWAYLRRYTDCPEELAQHVSMKTPQWASAITGLSVEEIEDFAQLYGKTKKSYLRLGYGFSRQRNGAVNMHAASCLAAITGSWQYEGGGAFHNNGGIFRWNKTLIEGLDLRDASIRILDQSRIGPILTGDKTDLRAGPPVTALLVQNTNPITVSPDTTKVKAGFAREDLFTCVHEQFMTETAKYADILLPATTFLEHDDIYQGGGHQYILLGPKVIEPLEDCRSNHDVICGLAKRLGANHPGFDMTVNEIIDWTLGASGWPGLEVLQQEKWFDAQPSFEHAHFLEGFGWDDGKFRFRANWAAVGPDHERVPKLPDHWPVIDEANAERPFRLVTAPSRSFLNTTFNETPTSIKREGRPTVLLHPADLAELAIQSGERVRVGNVQGSIVAHAKAFSGLQRKVTIIEGVWPNAAYGEGVGVNVLISAEAAAPNGGACFHDTAVWIKAVV